MAHPVLYISPDTAGLIYINGNLAGECDSSGPLVLPIAPQGAMYLEYHPLRAGFCPLSRRLNFSGGYIAPGTEPLEGLYIVAWPGSIIDVQISPEHIGALCGAQRLSVGDYDVYLPPDPPSRARIVRGGVLMNVRLPENASGVRALEAPLGRVMLIGRSRGGEFLQVIDPESGDIPLNLTGRSISPADHGGIQVVRDSGDAAGHEIREIWRPGGRGYVCEPVSVQLPSGKLTPASAETAALMLCQAILLGQESEARGYLTDDAQIRYPSMRVLVNRADACTALKYGAQPGCIGLMKLATPGYARVHLLQYDAVPDGDAWLINDIRLQGK